MTPRRAAWSRAVSSLGCARVDGAFRATLRFSSCAPAVTQSMIASARSSGDASGTCPYLEIDSVKMGRTSRVQLGLIAGAVEPLLATRTPATKVPWAQAGLL